VDIVNGCCLMAKAEMFRAVGVFDESLFIVHEESDLCLRALRAGFQCGVLGEALVWHKGSSSFQRSGRQLQRYYDTRNLYFLLKRHGGKLPGTRSFARSLVPFLRYAFYRYSLEMEAGSPPAARAVADGLADAVTGVKGVYASSRSRGALVAAALKVLRMASRA
jgi:GT2 family glycosyltransferase